MMEVLGEGLITDNKISCIRKNKSWVYDSLKQLHQLLIENKVIHKPIKDFGRMDKVSKMTSASVALALSDRSGQSDQSDLSDFGVLGTSFSGSLTSNIRYFEDYIDSGRKMGRGNLFVYTLPSTALAAAAMSFGFKGPLLYEMYTQEYPCFGKHSVPSETEQKLIPLSRSKNGSCSVHIDTLPEAILKHAERIILDQKCKGLVVVVAGENRIQSFVTAIP